MHNLFICVRAYVFLYDRVDDINLDSEDEEAIIERRRLMREKIKQKYKGSPQTADRVLPVAESVVSSVVPSPAVDSDTESVDSDTVAATAAADVEDEAHREVETHHIKRSYVAKEEYQLSLIHI